jgi:hypothetical protein
MARGCHTHALRDYRPSPLSPISGLVFLSYQSHIHSCVYHLRHRRPGTPRLVVLNSLILPVCRTWLTECAFPNVPLAGSIERTGASKRLRFIFGIFVFFLLPNLIPSHQRRIVFVDRGDTGPYVTVIFGVNILSLARNRRIYRYCDDLYVTWHCSLLLSVIFEQPLGKDMSSCCS